MGGLSQEAFWDARYSPDQDGPGEWYCSYADNAWLQQLIRAAARHDERLLVLGCGTSLLSQQLYDDGYHQVVSIDFSRAAIDHMRATAQDRPGPSYERMDMAAMTFADGSFDVVVDKGALDAASGDLDMARATLDEVRRVLVPGGRYVLVSCNGPRMLSAMLGARARLWRCSTTTAERHGASARRFELACHGHLLSKLG